MQKHEQKLSHFRDLSSAGFIVALVVAQFILSFFHPLCQALQRTDCDVIKAYKHAKACQSIISSQHNEGKFSELCGRRLLLKLVKNS